jgi:prolipoprotein diacylglyceryltransferase/protein-S-isoprenylcysteine O-methyltransferase Ste14/membrane-associated phospholipid phosphatase
MKTAGKLAYGFTFAVLLPVALAVWAVRLDHLFALPAIGAPALGIAIALGAALLMIDAVVSLRRYGRGWPMSPYPPERRVDRGAYALVSHPIYTGAVFLAAGMAIAMRSAAGLWIVTPVLALACVVFVIGYEHDATVRRFGPRQFPPLVRLPAADEEPPSIADRLSIYLLVLLPWLVAFEAANAITISHQARDGWTRFDNAIPIVPWTELIYALDYPLVLAVPLVLRTRRQLRDFAIDAWIAIVSVTIIYLALPIIVSPRGVPGGSVFAPLMMWERRFDTPATSFPAFHVIWALLAASAYARAFPRWRVLWWTLAAAISVSCLTTGMHATVDVVAGVVAASLILSGRRIARLILGVSERLANSWAEWDFGVVRAMSHGIYAAAGSFLGILIVSSLTGAPVAAFFIGAGIIVGAALWAQFIEGSPQLLRPFGYFGGVIGCCVAIAFTRDPWLMLAAYGVAAPVIQACGRCRCLVQGCCHGRVTGPEIGIRYRHPRSRVTRLSDMAAMPLHATQLYSIAWNVIVFVLLLRLWTAGASLQFIAGAYFILSGLGRFVEEHFRGEPQTRIIAGLRSYQWLSIASVVAGAVLTIIGNTQAPAMRPIDARTVAIGAAFAALTYLAYGVDFPRLNVRFARLV